MPYCCRQNPFSNPVSGGKMKASGGQLLKSWTKGCLWNLYCIYSAAIHQDGEKPVLFVPYFFRELLGFLLNWRKKVNVPSQKGLFATKQGHTE
jgi:hypothetical protein